MVSALLSRVVDLGRGISRSVLTRVPRQAMFALWGGGAVAIAVGVLVLSVVQSPTVTGVLSGLFVGIFTALLYAAAMGFLIVSLYRPARPQPPAEAARASALEGLLAPTLRELDGARREVIQQVKARSVLRVPAGIGAAVVIWVVGQTGSDPPGMFELFGFIFVGALAGEVWAIGKLDREYRQLYKTRVLPHLARRFGDLTYRHAAAQDTARTRARRILPPFERAKAEDEIAGTYHGLPVSIVEARLESGSGDGTRVIFDGLLIEVALPRALTGTTVVVSDAGLIGNLKAQWRSDGLERVRLEDPRFERRYEVYASDQVEARALLTPAFMQRFMALGTRPGLAAPGAIAEGALLVTALPKRVPTDLFEPPPYWKPSSGQVLVTLSEDISAVLALADTVIELDFWASGRKRSHDARLAVDQVGDV